MEVDRSRGRSSSVCLSSCSASAPSTRRNTATLPPCPADRCRCRTSAIARTTGIRAGIRRPRSPRRWRPARCAPAGSPVRRSRRRPDSRRRRRRWAGRRIRAHRGGHPADVAAVAAGDQRQQADRGVLGGVQRSRDLQRVDSVVVQRLWRDGVHHRHGVQGVRRHVQLDEVDHLTVQSAAQIADDLVGHATGTRPRVTDPNARRSPAPVTAMSVSSRANVAYPGSSAWTKAMPSSKSSESTT